MKDINKEKVTIRLEIGQLETIYKALSISNWPGAQDLGCQISCFVKRKKDELMKSSLEKILGRRW